jgi:ankyrin repeat protein
MDFLKKIFTSLIISTPAIFISYLFYKGEIKGFFFYIPFILSITIIIFFFPKSSNSQNHSELYKFIEGKQLNELINYLKKNNLSVKELHKITYYANVTPLIYAIGKDSSNIIDYLLENGYDLNYYFQNSLPPICYCAYLNKYEYLKKLLEYKNLDINVISEQFKANSLEIAVSRGSKKCIKLLLNAGMEFNIKKYNESIAKGNKFFNEIEREIKEILLKNVLLNKKIKYFNIHDKCIKKELKLKIFNTKPYLLENFLLDS